MLVCGLAGGLLAYLVLSASSGTTNEPTATESGQDERAGDRGKDSVARAARGRHDAPPGPGSAEDEPGPSATGESVASGAELRREDGYEPDGEWQSFPRSGFSVPEALANAPTSLAPSALYRHEDLNPLDVFVPSARRATVESILLEYQPRIARLHDAEAGTAAKELRQLVDAGTAPVVSKRAVRATSSDEARRRLRRTERRIIDAMRKAAGGKPPPGPPNVVIPSVDFQGKEPRVFTSEGDLLFHASLRELRVTGRLVQKRSALSLEMGILLLDWFQRHCGLSDAAVVEILRRTSELLEKASR